MARRVPMPERFQPETFVSSALIHDAPQEGLTHENSSTLSRTLAGYFFDAMLGYFWSQHIFG